MVQTYDCKCSLFPNGHKVKKYLRASHALEIQSHKDSLSSSGSSNSQTAADDASTIMSISLMDNAPRIERDGGLWSSSQEIYESVEESHLPATNLSIGDFQRGLSAVVASQTVRDISRVNLPRPAALGPKSSRGALAKKAERVIEAVEAEALSIAKLLDFDDNFPSHEDLRTLLDKATNTVQTSGNSLSLIKNTTPSVLDRKKGVLEMLRTIDRRISQLGALLPPQTSQQGPVLVEADTVCAIENLDTIAQVVILFCSVCHFIAGLGKAPCEFILQVANMLIRLAMATSLPNAADDHTESQHAILNQLPTSMYTALSRFDLDGRTTIYAACPTCNYTHEATYDRVSTSAIYPSQCTNRIIGPDGPVLCGADLLEERNDSQRPLKPFVSASLPDYLAQTLADSEIESLIKKACDDAMAQGTPVDSTNVFQSEFMRTFEGPIPGQLFIDRKDKVRVAFAMHVDFCNPNGTKRRSNHDSIGVISLANLNLPESIRYDTENLFLVGVIPGPHEPPLEEINHYLRPILKELEVGWSRGYHISHTADSPELGEVAEVAVVLSVNDLPAARKVSGTAGIGSHFYCTVCDSSNRSTMYDTQFQDWTRRDPSQMRAQAEAWRDALTSKRRKSLFDTNGVRWSEFWLLPYWDPSRMLVIDSMHCILEGIVHYHCRDVLCIDAAAAKAPPPVTSAFHRDWTTYAKTDPHFPDLPDTDIKQIEQIRKLLTAPLENEPSALSLLFDKLHGKKKQPLQYLLADLELEPIIVAPNGKPVTAVTKKHLTTILLNWRLKQPMASPDATAPNPCDSATFEYIQHVIKSTDTPSWINSVPSNYGEAAAGSIKADEWRILSTVYIPIALVTRWGLDNGEMPQMDSRQLRMLDHSMALFQATTLAVRYTMNSTRATKYRLYLKDWIDGLYSVHPHTITHSKRVNVHAAFHIYDFLLLFGPVISWWCFPFERLIGTLQRVKTNSLVGGPLETTITQSHMRAAKLRRWLRRPDCPEVIRQFKILFDKAFSVKSSTTPKEFSSPNSTEVAHYNNGGVNYSRASTHLGNSLILYYPPSRSVPSTVPVAGSIEKITVSSSKVEFHVRRQVPLPKGVYDPFRRYPHFPASLYMAQMESSLDKITPAAVLSHVARYEYDGHAVILNLSRD